MYLSGGFFDSKFLWLTNDIEEEVLKLASAHGIDHSDLVITSVKRTEMPLYLSLIDLGIFYIKNSFSKSASSPTKLGEMLLMGIPVLCNSGVGDLDGFFAKNRVGYCHDIDEAVDTNKLKALFSLDKAAIREVGLKYFSLSETLLSMACQSNHCAMARTRLKKYPPLSSFSSAFL